MSSRRTIPLVLLATMLGLATLLLPVAPTQAAGPDADPDLSISIRSLSPSRLSQGSAVKMTATVTNNDDHRWSKLQAYLVIPSSPFTTPAQVQEAIENRSAYTGLRVAEIGSYADVGDLAAGQTRSFRISVPYEQLRISGADGVYPIGVQILGTDTNGERSIDAIARATTFVPLISSRTTPVPASIVWPFLMPDHRGADGNYARPGVLLRAVTAGGRLRNLLDLATSTPANTSTILVDPALLVGVDDLARRRHIEDSFVMTLAQQTEVAKFLKDLLRLARTESCWVLDFDRPDDLALSQNGSPGGALSATIDEATDFALTAFQLSGRRVSWPTKNGVTAGLLRDLRGAGDSPVIVSPASLPDWEGRQGSLVQYTAKSGPLPLLVNDVLDAGVPGQNTVVTLRQRILSTAALATLQRAIDPASRADAVVVVDPSWNPGPVSSADGLSAAFGAPFTTGMSLDALLTRRLVTYRGRVPTAPKAIPLSRAQLEAASDILAEGNALRAVIPQTGPIDETLARDVAGVLGVRWRLDRATALAIAKARARQASAELERITLEGPPSVTLSSTQGGFPLTIRNGTDKAIRIGISLDASNPALDIPDVKAVDIAAGEGRTITVNVDLGRQKATTLTARLNAVNGKAVGPATVFNVRSSNVGVLLWVAVAVAGLFVLAGLAHRFPRRRRAQVNSERGADDD